MGKYVLGERVKVSAAFTAGGVATDPGTVTCKVKKPDGTETTYDSGTTPAVVDEAGVGAFSLTIATDQEGVWRYRFEGSAPADAPGEGQFSVRSIYEP